MSSRTRPAPPGSDREARPGDAGTAIGRRGLVGGVLGACLLGGTLASDSLTSRGIRAIRTSKPLVALTFDDGPDPDYTPAILGILDSFRVRATFFMIGRAAAQYPRLVEEVRSAGHAIANHTADHLRLDRLARPLVHDQIERGQQLLGPADEARRLFRPPFGAYSSDVSATAGSLGSGLFLWTTCLEANLRRRDVADAGWVTASFCRPGSIVLAHDGGSLTGPNPQSLDRSATIAALPHLLEAVHARGLRFATLPNLVASGSL